MRDVFKLAPLPRTRAAALRDATSPRREVRLSAVEDLARLAATDVERDAAVAALLHALDADPDAEVRGRAAVALADARATCAVEALVRAAADLHTRVRQMALVALGELADASDEAACEVLREALKDADPALRFQALVALGRLLGDGAIEHAVASTRDEDAQVRYVALRVLEERWEAHREPWPMPVLVRIRALLQDAAPEVRLVAAIVLARAGEPGGVEVLAQAVNGRSGAFPLEDELCAVELVGEMRVERARPGLVRRAFGLLGVAGDASAFQARVALAQLGDERAVEAIVRGLAAWSRDTRTLAVAAAGRARLHRARAAIAAMRGNSDQADPAAVDEALALIDEGREG